MLRGPTARWYRWTSTCRAFLDFEYWKSWSINPVLITTETCDPSKRRLRNVDTPQCQIDPEPSAATASESGSFNQDEASFVSAVWMFDHNLVKDYPSRKPNRKLNKLRIPVENNPPYLFRLQTSDKTTRRILMSFSMWKHKHFNHLILLELNLAEVNSCQFITGGVLLPFHKVSSRLTSDTWLLPPTSILAVCPLPSPTKY